MPHGKSPRHRPRRKAPRAKPSEVPITGEMRVQKILAAAGVASRRGAEELIRAGRVSVNGKPIGLGDSADPQRDKVAVDGERVRLAAPSYWMLNKPTGVVTTLDDPHGRRAVSDLLPETSGRLYPVGRLDRDSAGLLLLTNDGALTQRLLHPSHQSEKEYRVTVKGDLDEKLVGRLTRGVHLDDGPSAPTRVERVRYDSDDETTTFHLVMTEGRKRQIRRMLLALGRPVKKLVRVRVGPIKLGRLATGTVRPLRDHEIRALREYVDRLEVSGRRGRSGGRRKTAARAKGSRSRA